MFPITFDVAVAFECTHHRTDDVVNVVEFKPGITAARQGKDLALRDRNEAWSNRTVARSEHRTGAYTTGPSSGAARTRHSAIH